MSDDSKTADPGALWRHQPEEKSAVQLQQFVNRRTQELYSSTRSEIILSIGTAAFFAVVMAWRFSPVVDRLEQAGFALVIGWVLYSTYRFRDRIFRRDRIDTVAASGVDYYRQELERRRDHLKDAWIWHGPLFLACLISVASFVGRVFPGTQRLRNVLPLVLVLAVWTGMGLKRRKNQADQIQREIDDLDRHQ